MEMEMEREEKEITKKPSSLQLDQRRSGDGCDVEAGDGGAPAARKYSGWKCMPYIIGNEAAAKMATSGLTSNLAVYLIFVMNMNPVAAAKVSNIFFGASNFSSLVGAFLSDAYLGRFRTLSYTSVITFIGMITLTITAAVPRLRPPPCGSASERYPGGGGCIGPTPTQVGVLAAALAMLAVGSAGILPCSLPFGVDQFDASSDEGRRGLKSFFNWYYFTLTAAYAVGITAVVYVQVVVGWAVGFAVPTALMLVAAVVFFAGTPMYVLVEPSGSVITGMLQVIVASFRKRAVRLQAMNGGSGSKNGDGGGGGMEQLHNGMFFNPPISDSRVVKLPLTYDFRCLNKAAMKLETDGLREDGSPEEPWRLCSVQKVEEVKCLLRIVPVWLSTIVFFVAATQQWIFSTLQSLAMDRRLGHHFAIPAAATGAFSLISLVVFLPFYDRLLVPLARRFTGIDEGITLLQRQGIGLGISTVAMVVSALVETKRRRHSLGAGGAPPTVLWLAPPLALMGVSEAFSSIGQAEFYNRQFPENMQSLAGALFWCSQATAAYLSNVLIAVVQSDTSWLRDDLDAGKLEKFYYLVAVIGAVNFAYFVVVARRYRYKGMPSSPLANASGAGL